MGKNGVTGMIVPLDTESVHLVFHHRPVIPLFVESFPDDLEVGDRAFLYVSGRSLIDGEGGIGSITARPSARCAGMGTISVSPAKNSRGTSPTRGRPRTTTCWSSGSMNRPSTSSR